MNKFKNLFFLDLKLMMKNRMSYLKLILFPIVLILILGSIFNQNQDITIKPFSIAVWNQDTGVVDGSKRTSFGDLLVEKVLKSKESSVIMDVKEAGGSEEGQKLVRSGKASVFIHIPGDFSNACEKDLKTDITLVVGSNQSIQGDFVENVLGRFLESIKTAEIDRNEAYRQATLAHLSEDGVKKIMNHISGIVQESVSVPKDTGGTGRKPIAAMQYYSIGMMVMFSIITAFTIIHSMLDEKLNCTYFRIQTTPVRSFQYSAGKLAGIIFAMVMQMLVLVAFTYVVLGMKWGNLFYSLAVTLIYGFAIGSIVLLAGFLSKNHRAISGVSTPILFIFSFLGGSIVPRDTFPKSFGFVQNIVPNGQAIDAYIRIAQGGNLNDILSNLFVLFLTGVAFFAATLILFKNKGGNRNANA